jgi:PilZ domain
MPAARPKRNSTPLADHKPSAAFSVLPSEPGAILQPDSPSMALAANLLGDMLRPSPFKPQNDSKHRASDGADHYPNRRGYPRTKLRVAVRIVRVAGRRVAKPATLFSANISSSGVFLRSPFSLETHTPVDLEIELVKRAGAFAGVQMMAVAHVVRRESDSRVGWHGLAFSFDDISFERQELLPPRAASL